MRFRRLPTLIGLLAGISGMVGIAAAQGGYKLVAGKATPPAAIKAGLKPLISDAAFTLTNAEGKLVARIWPAKAIAAGKVPITQGPGTVADQLTQGAFMGVIELAVNATDAKEQPVKAGVYAMRYLTQPDDGNHLGTTDFSDFAVLFSMKVDPGAPVAGRQALIDAAFNSIGHPRVFPLHPAKATQATPGLGRDANGHLVAYLTLTAKTKTGKTAAFKVGLLPGLLRVK